MTAWLTIIEPGVAATLQDRGREGRQRLGVPASGALDEVSLAIANRLVGNAPSEAAIEVLAAGLAFNVCAASVMLAAAGTAEPFLIETAGAALRVPPFQSAIAKRGDVVRFQPPKAGALFYIAVAGGFDVPPVFGSRSVYRRAALGPLEGRALQVGDALPLRLRDAPPDREASVLDMRLCAPEVLRVMRGPNADYFTARAFDTLFTSAYTIEPVSDRMGLRLRGPQLERAIEGELPSQGTTAGGLQAPADGQPILLLADRQTTGGYPRIATVIGADIAAAGRLAAGMSIRFAEVSRKDALRLLQEQRDWLAALPAKLKPLKNALSAERLLANNLIDGVTSGFASDHG